MDNHQIHAIMIDVLIPMIPILVFVLIIFWKKDPFTRKIYT